MSRKALGRGLSALFPQTASLEQDLVEIGIEQIDLTLLVHSDLNLHRFVVEPSRRPLLELLQRVLRIRHG